MVVARKRGRTRPLDKKLPFQGSREDKGKHSTCKRAAYLFIFAVCCIYALAYVVDRAFMPAWKSGVMVTKTGKGGDDEALGKVELDCNNPPPTLLKGPLVTILSGSVQSDP